MSDIELTFGCSRPHIKPFELTYELLGIEHIQRPSPLDLNTWDPQAIRTLSMAQYRSLLDARYNANVQDKDRREAVMRSCIRLAVDRIPVPCWISKRFDDFENYGKSKMPNKFPPMTFIWCPDKMDKSLAELSADLSRYCPPRAIVGPHTIALLHDYNEHRSPLSTLSNRIDICRQENAKLFRSASKKMSMGVFVWDQAVQLV